jgi:NAD(P)-dependent dehydrogenase (short-subunit alcohol dehydrogenase family)
LCDRNAQALDDTAMLARSLGAEVVTRTGDMTTVETPASLVEAASTSFGGLDAIVSNAGMLRGALLKDLTVEDYEGQFAIHTRPTWLLGKAAYQLLARSGGSIVATASISAEHPTPPLGAYSASKAALVRLVEQMAIEWGPDGIRCNCVSPGPTRAAPAVRSWRRAFQPVLAADMGSAWTTRLNRRAWPLQSLGTASRSASRRRSQMKRMPSAESSRRWSLDRFAGPAER